jgi:hypothetical protein
MRVRRIIVPIHLGDLLRASDVQVANVDPQLLPLLCALST